MSSDTEDCDDTQGWQHVQDGEVPAANDRCMGGCSTDVLGLDGKFVGLNAFGAEALDRSHPDHGLLHHGCELSLLGLYCEHGGMDRGREPLGGNVDQGQRRQRHDGQDRIHHEQHHDDAEDHRQVRQRQGHHDHEALDELQIARGSSHQLTTLSPIVKADVEPEEMIEEPLTQATFGDPTLAKREPPSKSGVHSHHGTRNENDS